MSTIQQISHGTYGCIYYPSIPCEGEKPSHKDKRYITKIQWNEESVKTEWNISQKVIQKIPYYSFFYAPIIKRCMVDLHQIDESQRCKLIEKEQERAIIK